MRQIPSYKKYKKYHKVNYVYSKIKEQNTFFPNWGLSAIQATESGTLTYKQIEACRRAIRRGLKKTGKIWIRVFTSNPITKKPVASRMGKGKGNISHWIVPVRKGQVLFEITEFHPVKAVKILKSAVTRLPFNSKIIFLKY